MYWSKPSFRLSVIFTLFIHSVKLIRGDGTTSPSSEIHVSIGTTTSETLPFDDNTHELSREYSSHSPGEITTVSIKPSVKPNSTDELPDYLKRCPSNVDCSKLGGECLNCDFNEQCTYGSNVTSWCQPKSKIVCKGATNFTRWYICQYCYQTPSWSHECTESTSCRVVAAPPDKYLANCTVTDDTLCLGQRIFHKYLSCNWTSGKRWSTALILSITLGGFGADRFYLGLWREGIGKLFSFGGLGVWTLLDVVLIATGYVGPADGSLYL